MVKRLFGSFAHFEIELFVFLLLSLRAFFACFGYKSFIRYVFRRCVFLV